MPPVSTRCTSLAAKFPQNAPMRQKIAPPMGKNSHQKQMVILKLQTKLGVGMSSEHLQGATDVIDVIDKDYAKV